MGCDGHVVRYGFVGWVDNQSILMTVNIISSRSLYVLHSSIFYSLYSFQLTWTEAKIPKEDYGKTLIKYVSVLRQMTILTISQSTAEEGKS